MRARNTKKVVQCGQGEPGARHGKAARGMGEHAWKAQKSVQGAQDCVGKREGAQESARERRKARGSAGKREGAQESARERRKARGSIRKCKGAQESAREMQESARECRKVQEHSKVRKAQQSVGVTRTVRVGLT